MKISFFVFNLSMNPIVRAIPIAKALEKLGYEIEILGLLLGNSSVFEPYKDAYCYKTIQSKNNILSVIKNSVKLSKMATGDIIYAFKPLFGSFFPAILASKFGLMKKLMLDIEDDELHYDNQGLFFFYHDIIRGWRPSTQAKYNFIMHISTKFVKDKTVSSRKLQKRYGGKIILHGPDHEVYNPYKFIDEVTSNKQYFGLPINRKLILFAGMPWIHKGIDIIIDAVLEFALYDLVLAGPNKSAIYLAAKNKLKSRCHILGQIPNTEMPKLLSVVDIIPILQRKTNYAEAQIPAKLLEAMAMEKIIIASEVSDLPLILGKNEKNQRGWNIPPEDGAAFIEVLNEINNNQLEALKRAKEARKYFIQNVSVGANANKLNKLIRRTEI